MRSDHAGTRRHRKAFVTDELCRARGLTCVSKKIALAAVLRRGKGGCRDMS